MDLNTAEATETLGSLPPDWRSARIEEIASVGSGGTPSRKNPAYWRGTIPWVTTAQIDFGTIAEASECITEAGLRCSAARILAPGTLLLALYGQGKTRGKVAKLGISAATNQACASIAPGSHVDGDYLFHFLASRYQALRSASNAGSQENLSGRIVKDTLVALPPKAEQAAIATALSDVDTLLTKLDQLIAKKRDLKQAAVQQLLTGRTRLEGFATPWQHIQMGRLGSFIKGRGLAKDDLARGGELPAVPYTAIYTDFGQIASMMDVAGRVSRSRAEVTVNKPSLLIASSSNMLENIGKAVALCVDDEVAVGGDVLIFRTQADVRFLSYLLSTEVHRRRVVALSQGSTIRHVYAATFSAYEVELPSRDEQVAIADALADIDAELAALKARRDKTRQLKQGMMQALLTGWIRLG